MEKVLIYNIILIINKLAIFYVNNDKIRKRRLRILQNMRRVGKIVSLMMMCLIPLLLSACSQGDFLEEVNAEGKQTTDPRREEPPLLFAYFEKDQEADPKDKSSQQEGAESPDQHREKGKVQQIEVVRGGFCWEYQIDLFNKSTVCTDTAGMPDLLQGVQPTVVDSTGSVILEFEAEPSSIQFFHWTEESLEEIERMDQGYPLGLNVERPGVYLYEVRADWEQGYSYYAFSIEVR